MAAGSDLVSTSKQSSDSSFGIFNRLGAFQQVTQVFGVLPGYDLLGITNGNKVEDSFLDNESGSQSHYGARFPFHQNKMMETTQIIASDILINFGEISPRKAPTPHCKAMRKAVKEMSQRHEIVFKGLMKKLNLNEDNLFTIFGIVADELFNDGEVNWGRIVALFAFAAHIVKFHTHNTYSTRGSVSLLEVDSSQFSKDKVASFLGKYVTSKLGQWIIDNGGWDAFLEKFSDHADLEQIVWRGLLYTAIGFGALATLVASR